MESDWNMTVTRDSGRIKYIKHAEKVTQEWADEDWTAAPQSPEVSELSKLTSSPSPTSALRRSQRKTRPPEKLIDYFLLVR